MSELVPPQLFVTILLASLCPPPGVAPWRFDRTVDGMRIETREAMDAPFREIRVTAVSSADLQTLCDAVFAPGSSSKPEGRFKKREVLRETETDRWTYEQISVPVVRDRDYVMHAHLDVPATQGRCEVSFRTESDPGYPPVRGLVRIPCIHGHWSLVPENGAVRVSYEVYSDPGGEIPPFLVRAGQRDAAVQFMRTILERASEVESPKEPPHDTRPRPGRRG